MIDSISITEKVQQSQNPLTGLTVLEREKKEKKMDQENIEEILQTGQENRKKGIKATQEINKAIEEQKLKRKNEVLNKLDLKKQFDTSYKNALAQSLADVLALIEWLPKWTADVVVTDGHPIQIKGKAFATKPGILLIVYMPNGGVFHRGITITKEPPLDYAAVYNLAMQAENTMDEVRKRIEQKKEDATIVDKYGKSFESKPIVRT